MTLIEIIKKINTGIKELEDKEKNEIQKIKKTYSEKIFQLKIALETIKEMNTVCLECEGKGSIGADESFYGERREQITCKRCNGTGKEPVRRNN